MNLSQTGKRIKQCRKNMDLTQEKLAEHIEVSPHYIYEIERGTKAMSINTLYNISETLNVSADYLLYGYEKNTPVKYDQLSVIIENIPLRQRDNVAHILSSILPYIK